MAGYQTEAQRQEELKKAKLIVRVIEARGIAAGDVGGTSDPFLELRIKNQIKIHKTRTIKKTLNPFWNEEFTLYPENMETDFLQMKLYDEDASTSNDLLGEIDLPVAALQNKRQGSPEEWRQVMIRKGPTTFAPGQGELKLQFTYTPAPGDQSQQSQPQQPSGYPQPPQGQYPTPPQGQYPTPAQYPTPPQYPSPVSGQYPQPGQYPMPGGAPASSFVVQLISGGSKKDKKKDKKKGKNKDVSLVISMTDIQLLKDDKKKDKKKKDNTWSLASLSSWVPQGTALTLNFLGDQLIIASNEVQQICAVLAQRKGAQPPPVQY